MKKKIVPPEKLYVVCRVDTSNEYNEDTQDYYTQEKYILGFLHGYDSKKSFEKKHHTQNNWAYISTLKIVDNGNETFDLKGYIHTHIRSHSKWVDVPMSPEMNEKIKPRIWLNEPLDGFRLVESVSRYSTSNKLWRVMDPRGIVFEISTGCLEELMLNTTIERGVIHGKCQWQSNSKLILVE